MQYIRRVSSALCSTNFHRQSLQKWKSIPIYNVVLLLYLFVYFILGVQKTCPKPCLQIKKKRQKLWKFRKLRQNALSKKAQGMCVGVWGSHHAIWMGLGGYAVVRIKQQQMSITVESLMHLEELSRKLCCGNFTGWGMQKKSRAGHFQVTFSNQV